MVKTSNGYMITRKGIQTKQDVENEKKLPALEKKTKARQRENIIDKLIDTGKVTGKDTGKFRYITKDEKQSKKEEDDNYTGYREETGEVEMPGKAPIKNNK